MQPASNNPFPSFSPPSSFAWLPAVLASTTALSVTMQHSLSAKFWSQRGSETEFCCCCKFHMCQQLFLLQSLHFCCCKCISPESFLLGLLFAIGQCCAPGRGHHHNSNENDKNIVMYHDTIISSYPIHSADPPLGSSRP